MKAKRWNTLTFEEKKHVGTCGLIEGSALYGVVEMTIVAWKSRLRAGEVEGIDYTMVNPGDHDCPQTIALAESLGFNGDVFAMRAAYRKRAEEQEGSPVMTTQGLPL